VEHTDRVRWAELFADLEGELDADSAAELAAEVSERSRTELGRLRLVDRLRAGAGTPVTLALPHATVSGRLTEVGAEWVLVAERGGREALVLLAAVLAVQGVGERAEEPGSEGRVASRLRLASALRALARDREPVAVLLTDGSSLTGTIDRVGQDFVELALHDPGEPRRAGTVRAVRLVATGGVSLIRPA
jgi:hypothetical protein